MKIVFPILMYLFGLGISQGVKEFFSKPTSKNKLVSHALILFSLFFFSSAQFGFKNSAFLINLIFLFFGLISPVLVSGIQEFLLESKGLKDRLEILTYVVIMLTFPFSVNLLGEVSANNKHLQEELTNLKQYVQDDIDELKATTGDTTKYYRKLIEKVASSKNSNEKKLYEEHLRLLRLQFLGTEDSVKNFYVCKADTSCTEQETKDFEDFSNIYNQTNHKQFPITRAKTIYLLRYVTTKRLEVTNSKRVDKLTWEDIINRLMEKMLDDKEILWVSKTALDSFRELVPEFKNVSPKPTIDQPETVFDFNEAELFWKNNKAKIIDELYKH